MTPTARSLAWCRKYRLTAGVVERYCSFTKRRHDFLGIGDMIVLTEDGAVLVQACAGASHAARRTKMLAEPRLYEWLSCSRRHAEIWSWSKKGARGKRKLWQLRREKFERTGQLQT